MLLLKKKNTNTKEISKHDKLPIKKKLLYLQQLKMGKCGKKQKLKLKPKKKNLLYIDLGH